MENKGFIENFVSIHDGGETKGKLLEDGVYFHFKQVVELIDMFQIRFSSPQGDYNRLLLDFKVFLGLLMTDKSISSNISAVIYNKISELSNLETVVPDKVEAENLHELKRLAHNGLPDECIRGWGEVKFCENRNGDGNKCKLCSDLI